jgi:hypothetical protein
MAYQTPTQPAQQAEDARTDLLAALAASRELGPEMDRALVESYLQKHPLPADGGPADAGAWSPRGAPWPGRPVVGGIGLLIGAVIVLAALIASGGHAFWLLWVPIALGFWWWRGWPAYGRYGRWGYHGYPVERDPRHEE